MFRTTAMQAKHGEEEDFRWRGTEIGRLEGFSDAVFGFALTLLVVSLEVPRTYHDLALLVWDLPAFAVCFLILFVIWNGHYVFCRRYGLADTATKGLTAALLFLVLFYVYPLKFLWRFLFGALLLVSGWMPESVRADYAARITPMVSERDAGAMMVLYGAGYCAVMATFAALYAHAARRRAQLELDAVETYLTRWAMRHHLMHAAVAVLSIAIAATGRPATAGWSYFLLFPIGWAYGSQSGRVVRRLKERAA